MRYRRALIRFRAACSPRSVRECRRRCGSPPFPVAAAASCRFWPFGAVALGTLKAIIRFAHKQTPGDLQRAETRPSLAILRGGLARLSSIRGLPQLSADLLDQ